VLPLEEGAQTSLWSIVVYGCASRLCAEQDSALRVPASLAASAGIITTVGHVGEYAVPDGETPRRDPSRTPTPVPQS